VVFVLAMLGGICCKVLLKAFEVGDGFFHVRIKLVVLLLRVGVLLVGEIGRRFFPRLVGGGGIRDRCGSCRHRTMRWRSRGWHWGDARWLRSGRCVIGSSWLEGALCGGLEVGESEILGAEGFQYISEAEEEFRFPDPELGSGFADEMRTEVADVLGGGSEFF
jgi:hypothetical protein